MVRVSYIKIRISSSDTPFSDSLQPDGPRELRDTHCFLPSSRNGPRLTGASPSDPDPDDYNSRFGFVSQATSSWKISGSWDPFDYWLTSPRYRRFSQPVLEFGSASLPPVSHVRVCHSESSSFEWACGTFDKDYSIRHFQTVKSAHEMGSIRSEERERV